MNAVPSERPPRQGMRSLCSPTAPQSYPGGEGAARKQVRELSSIYEAKLSNLLPSGDLGQRARILSADPYQLASSRSLPARSKPQAGRGELAAMFRRSSSGSAGRPRQDGSNGAYGSVLALVMQFSVASVRSRYHARQRVSGLYLIPSR